jgi:hypothetical protein
MGPGTLGRCHGACHHQSHRGMNGGGGENRKGMVPFHLPAGLGVVVDPDHLAPDPAPKRLRAAAGSEAGPHGRWRRAALDIDTRSGAPGSDDAFVWDKSLRPCQHSGVTAGISRRPIPGRPLTPGPERCACDPELGVAPPWPSTRQAQPPGWG